MWTEEPKKFAKLVIEPLKGHDDKPATRRAEQLKTRLDELEDELRAECNHEDRLGDMRINSRVRKTY